MALATVQISESNGAGESVTDNISNMNMGTVDTPDLTPSTSNAIPREASPAGFGMEKWERIKLVAKNDSSEIDNFKVWKSAGVYETDAALDFDDIINTSYTQPTVSESAVALTPIPTTEPSSNLAGSLTSDGTYSINYGVFQYHADTTHPPGSIATLTITFQYDES